MWRARMQGVSSVISRCPCAEREQEWHFCGHPPPATGVKGRLSDFLGFTKKLDCCREYVGR